MAGKMNVEAWVALFREIGLDEEKMHRWHRLFESRHPEAHQDFLAWLGCSDQAGQSLTVTRRRRPAAAVLYHRNGQSSYNATGPFIRFIPQHTVVL